MKRLINWLNKKIERKIFVIADTHFFHGNIIRYCNRPFYSYQEMNEVMIKKWNQKVGKNDIVIHCGDFCFRGKDGMEKSKYIKRRLNGKIILIQGNHDKEGMQKLGFKVKKGKYIYKNIIFTHEPLKKEDIPEGFINIHGHIHHHNSYNGINVSVEKTNYEPVELSTLAEIK